MTPTDASLRLLSLLWQASWQGALFAAAVGLVCLLFRVPAPVRAWLWFLAGLKFFGGFLYLLVSGRGMPLELRVPTPLMSSVSRASAIQEAPFYYLAPWVTAGWVAGVLLCVILVVVRARTTYKTMSGAHPCSTETVPPMLSALSSRIGVAPDHIPPVHVAPEAVEGPQVMLSGSGCVVILPESLLPPSPDALNEADLRFVIAHELAHIRRGDLWAGLLFAGMQALFFFHPCAVWVKREWEAAREEACDLLALHACADGDRDLAARYGALLLRLGSGTTASSVTSAQIAGSPFAALRRRLTHLSRHQNETGGRCSFALALIGLPVLAALLLPLEPRWVATRLETRTMTVVPRPAPPIRASIQSAELIPAPVHTSSLKVTAPKVVPSIKVRSETVYRSVLVANRVPVVIPTPAPHRPFVPPPSITAASVLTKPAMPTLVEPRIVTGGMPVEPFETASAPGPVPVEPEIGGDLSEPSPSQMVMDPASNTATGASFTARSSDTVAARTPTTSFDTKTAPRSGPVSPSLENTRSRSTPTSAASPSTAPAPSESPVPESDKTPPRG